MRVWVLISLAIYGINLLLYPCSLNLYMYLVSPLLVAVLRSFDIVIENSGDVPSLTSEENARDHHKKHLHHSLVPSLIPSP